MKLSILDQSPVSEGNTPAEALAQTAALAREADRLGYHRFWVSEHHAAPGLAGTSPEVLIAHLAAVTSNIRVGAGAVLLPHYSAYKVAENFRVLEALYPGRIDLGLGRAAGGGALAVHALQENRIQGNCLYEEQIADLLAYLRGGPVKPHRYAGLQAAPEVETSPEVWVLGAGKGSAALAAQSGTGYAFARFINGNGIAEALGAYRAGFSGSGAAAAPRSLVAVFVSCAETAGEADRLASSIDLSLVQLEREHRSFPTPPVESALNYSYSPYDRFRVGENRQQMVVGSPGEVRQQFETMAAEYGCDEIMFAAPLHRFEDRLHCLRLVAKACGLQERKPKR
ncbi:LLM class flavin-dependent oxidoreductase ['Paenibacillus yunnanensis' Narsing Rao et al. 2020]|uniref:LLM class flavin-dependent oxidoreductase n=1 Tax=Paenibacillus tengchongensis TaxID=2608684 RepID=UPI00124DE47C|nr:LLM class flavin-dependent oxidoreductase [Paenibacillus tengchongensis]